MQQTSSDYPAWRPPFSLRLATLPSRDCAYLPGRPAVSRGFLAGSVDSAAFQALLDTGFRRSGQLFYQPVCPGCRSCTPLRIDTATFKPSSSQRRVWRRNADLAVSVDTPRLTDQKRDLYRLYLASQHPPSQHPPPAGEEVSAPNLPPDDPPEDPADSLEEFLYISPVETLEIEYRLSPASNNLLVGIGIVDLARDALSSVYFFWHPAHRRRSLGLYSALRELDLARRLRKPWYHLGYWVPRSDTMHYKAELADHQLLGTDRVWRNVPRSLPSTPNSQP